MKIRTNPALIVALVSWLICSFQATADTLDPLILAVSTHVGISVIKDDFKLLNTCFTGCQLGSSLSDVGPTFAARASGVASAGVLNAFAESGYSTVSNHNDQTAISYATSEFAEGIVIDGPAGQKGILETGMTVDGIIAVNDGGGGGSALVSASLKYNYFDSSAHPTITYATDDLGLAAGSHEYDFKPVVFTYDVPIYLDVRLSVFAQVTGPQALNNSEWSGLAIGNFEHTASLTRFDVLNLDGTPATGFTVRTSDGTMFPLAPDGSVPPPDSSVPEPSSMILMCTSMAALLFRRRRAGLPR